MVFARGKLLKVVCMLVLLHCAINVNGAWREIWDQDVSAPTTGLDPIRVRVGLDESGNVFQVRGMTRTNMALIKYSGRSGEVLWTNNLELDIWTFSVEPEGNVIVLGSKLNDEGRNIYTAKFSNVNGELLWGREYPCGETAGAGPRSLEIGASGNVYVLGGAQRGTNLVTTILKYGVLNGQLEWTREVAVRNIWNMKVNETGECAIAGKVNDNFYIAKYDNGGTALWMVTLPSTNRASNLGNVTLDRAGNVVVTGHTADDKMHTAKLRGSDGALVWTVRHTEAKDAYSMGKSLFACANGDVVVVSQVHYWWESQLLFGEYVARYNADDGGEKWRRRLEPRPDTVRGFQAEALVVDEKENFYIPIAKFPPGDPIEPCTYKINAETGEILFEVAHADLGPLDAAFNGGYLAITGFYRPPNTWIARTILFKTGPELRTKVVGDDVEIGWDEEQLGWRLEKLSGGLDAGHWTWVEGSTMTNFVRELKSETSEIFRLVSE